MFDWPHAPPHRFIGTGVYFVTASTYLKQHHYRRTADLDRFVATLLSLARRFEIALQSWCALSNHYHLVGQGAGEALRLMLAELHSVEAKACNFADGTPGRKVWFQCRDTALTFERSWLARLKYTNENAVKHRIVRTSTDYRWCSAGWMERMSSPAFMRSLSRFRLDRVNVLDDFDVIPPE